MVPVGALVSMAASAVVGIAVPVLLAWWLVKKHYLKTLPILVGAAVFVLFALVLEAMVHQVVLKGSFGSAIIGNVWYYATYGGLMAGLFEESGRFLSMKFVLKKEPGTALTGLGYGIGHGGAEMLILFGVTMVSNLVISILINAGQADSLFSKVPADSSAQLQAQLTQLESLSAGTLLLGLWERISALILHLGLSLMVWTAVRRAGKWIWLFPAAILLHGVVDAVAVILSKSASMVSLEIIVFAMAIAVGTIGLKVSQTLQPSTE